MRQAENSVEDNIHLLAVPDLVDTDNSSRSLARIDGESSGKLEKMRCKTRNERRK